MHLGGLLAEPHLCISKQGSLPVMHSSAIDGCVSHDCSHDNQTD
jgi:hypothetical protein